MNGLDWTAIIVAFIALFGTLFNGILFYKARKREKQRNRILLVKSLQWAMAKGVFSVCSMLRN